MNINRMTKLLVALMVIMQSVSLAQDSPMTITIKKGSLGNKYYKEGKILTLKKLNNLLEGIPETKIELDKAKEKMKTGNMFAAPGGFLIGWPLGSAITGEEVNTSMILGGCVLAGIGIYISNEANIHYKNAVDIYNLKVN